MKGSVRLDDSGLKSVKPNEIIIIMTAPLLRELEGLRSKLPCATDRAQISGLVDRAMQLHAEGSNCSDPNIHVVLRDICMLGECLLLVACLVVSGCV